MGGYTGINCKLWYNSRPGMLAEAYAVYLLPDILAYEPEPPQHVLYITLPRRQGRRGSIAES